MLSGTCGGAYGLNPVGRVWAMGCGHSPGGPGAGRRGVWLEHFWQELRYALRPFRRSPGFAATAVVSLAVGIAAATGVFSILNAALLNPFPFADINRIVRLDMNDKGKPRGLSVTARQLVPLQRSEVFDGAFVLDTWQMTLTGFS